MLSRVFTLTLSPREGSNSFFPPLFFPYRCLKRRYWIITSRTLTSRHLRDILARRVPSYFLPSRYAGAINTRTRVHRENAEAFSRHIYRPPGPSATTTHTRTRSWRPVARQVLTLGKTRNRSCAGKSRGTRFTDPSYKRRYRYLYRLISRPDD